MNQIILTLEDNTLLESLCNVLNSMKGITYKLSTTNRTKKNELDLALDDIEKGNVIEVGSVDNLMSYLK
ncbi:MAG: hypothetical protein MJZ08_08640 [Bacteroidaceae bacterium]|nr:hypothetical protein [Bacteroidaceae bacterium]